MFDFLRPLFAKWAYGEVEEIGVGIEQGSVTGSKSCKGDRVRSVARGHAILGPGEPAIHLHVPRICRRWIYKRPVDEGSHGGIGNVPRGVAGGCSGYFGLGLCELITEDSFVPCYPQEGCRTRSSVEE